MNKHVECKSQIFRLVMMVVQTINHHRLVLMPLGPNSYPRRSRYSGELSMVGTGSMLGSDLSGSTSSSGIVPDMSPDSRRQYDQLAYSLQKLSTSAKCKWTSVVGLSIF